MNGTQKQVQWATDIQAQMLRSITEWREKIAAHNAPEADKVAHYAKLDATQAKIESADAAYMIEHRQIMKTDYNFIIASNAVKAIMREVV